MVFDYHFWASSFVFFCLFSCVSLVLFSTVIFGILFVSFVSFVGFLRLLSRLILRPLLRPFLCLHVRLSFVSLSCT
jgi:hypothetical protein